MKIIDIESSKKDEKEKIAPAKESFNDNKNTVKNLDSPVFDEMPKPLQNQSVSWNAFSGYYYVKNAYWYLFVIFITCLLMVLSFWITRSYVSAMTFALIGIVVIVLGSQKPEKMAISMDDEGITIDKTLYHFDQINSFWIFYDNPRNLHIICKMKSGINDLIIPLGDMDPVYVREILLQYISEKYEPLSFSNLLMKLMGL